VFVQAIVAGDRAGVRADVRVGVRVGIRTDFVETTVDVRTNDCMAL